MDTSGSSTSPYFQQAAEGFRAKNSPGSAARKRQTDELLSSPKKRMKSQPQPSPDEKQKRKGSNPLAKLMEGKTEEEALSMKLPDYLAANLDVIFIGINPGVVSAARMRHYANPCNHFWPLLFESGLVSERLTAADDHRCLQFGFGLTNMVARTSHSSSDLSRSELRDGARDLLQKLQSLKPLVACFNGKGIYEIFSGEKKCNLGRQRKPVDGTDVVLYVMPSTSPRAASFPRASDKLRFFQELKTIVDERKAKPASHTSVPGQLS